MYANKNNIFSFIIVLFLSASIILFQIVRMNVVRNVWTRVKCAMVFQTALIILTSYIAPYVIESTTSGNILMRTMAYYGGT